MKVEAVLDTSAMLKLDGGRKTRRKDDDAPKMVRTEVSPGIYMMKPEGWKPTSAAADGNDAAAKGSAQELAAILQHKRNLPKRKEAVSDEV